MTKLLFLSAMLCVTASVTAQDVRNNVVGSSRTASYQQVHSKRGDVVAMIQPRLEPFYHGVASGDPTASSVILWTRVTPRNSDASIPLTWVIATDTSFSNVITSGSGTVTSETDFCFNVDVKGLQPGTTYYYNFRAYDRNSLTGRTKTTPEGSYSHARVGVVTCSNYPAGFFNAYARLADRNDIDVVLHMGDYIYEYDADTASYAGAIGKELGRSHEPNKELIELVDYRTRYGQYRLDPDLIRLHQQHPVVHVWDDHESANDAYTDGAENHDPTEGSWEERKNTSKRVHSEWMPVRLSESGNIYRAVRLGDLAYISMLDTRLEGRDVQVQGYLDSSTQAQKDSLNDPDRQIMSQTQFDWLAGNLGQAHQWNIIGSQVLFTPVETNPIDTAYLFEAIGPVLAAFLRPQLPQLQDLFDFAFNGDVWSNYPAQRDQLIEVLNDEEVGRTVVVSGDLHMSFAFSGNWPQKPVDVVEFMTPSITSPNFDENLATNEIVAFVAPQLVKSVDTTIQQLNDHVSYMDLSSHGYMVLDIQPEQIQTDWYHVDTLYLSTTNESWSAGRITTDGKGLQTAQSPAPNKSTLDIAAPTEPRQGVTSVAEVGQGPQTLLGFGPTPATSEFYVSLISEIPATANVTVYNLSGTIVQQHRSSMLEAGLNTISLDVQSLDSGPFYVLITMGDTVIRVKGLIQR